MKNNDNIKNKYIQKGIPEHHILYAMETVKNKTKREYIFKNLTSDVRKVDPKTATDMLDYLIGLKVPFYTYSKKKFQLLKHKNFTKGVKEQDINFAFNEMNEKRNQKL